MGSCVGDHGFQDKAEPEKITTILLSYQLLWQIELKASAKGYFAETVLRSIPIIWISMLSLTTAYRLQSHWPGAVTEGHCPDQLL